MHSRCSRKLTARLVRASSPFDFLSFEAGTKENPMSAQSRKVVHSDIKPKNTPELASRYLDVPNMPWEATKFPGIQIKVLYSDDSGITTALFKLAPGAVV